MPLSIAHFSDLHYADETLAEADRCFSHAVDEAIRRRVDAAIITGDTTDHALTAHSPAFFALARQIRRLADHCPVLMLQGTFSHEPPGMLSLFPLLGGRYPIHVADRLQQVALTPANQWVASGHWRFQALPANMRLLCTCIPTMNKAALAASVGAADAASAMGEQLTRVVAGYESDHLAARLRGVPVVALSHGTVHGCVTEHGVPMAGADHEFTTGTLFAAEASAVMLGHIHKHQSWECGGRLVAYAGSIGRLHYGEQGDKGFLLWAVDADASSADLLPTPARRSHEIAFEGPPDMDALAQFAAKHDIAGAWVRVRWQVLEEERDLVDRRRIEQLLAEAADVKLEGRIIPVTRARASGIARELSLPRQITHWATVTGTHAPDLLACLDQLRQHTPENIVARIFQKSPPPPASKRPNTSAISVLPE
ncbi:exonuclease SbcCD subunit D [Pseudoduganella sp. UC29_106]|uniref:metallophosphoesterase family protein n=1 Tax=Pseudoduganella sp. UC29_106 TaxID=3374553 RepID=UPI0037572A80